MTPVKNCRRYQRSRLSLPPVSSCAVDTRGKFATGVNSAGGNLPPDQGRRRRICHRCRWHRWQIIGTISGCRHLKVNLKTKIYIYVNSTTQRCLNKIIQIFAAWRFFLYAIGVVDTGGAPWVANISVNYWKNLKWPWWYTQMLAGNWFMKKTRSQKSCDTVPWKCVRGSKFELPSKDLAGALGWKGEKG